MPLSPTSSRGGSLPGWWTVVSTAGSESLTLAGRQRITQDDFTQAALDVVGDVLAQGSPLLRLRASDGTHDILTVDSEGSFFVTLQDAGNNSFQICGPNGSQVFIVEKRSSDGETIMSFFGSPPVVRPTGVAVTAAGIHAALSSLGLLTA